MIRLTDCLDMFIVVDWDIKPQNKQTNKTNFGQGFCTDKGDNPIFETLHSDKLTSFRNSDFR